MQFLQQTRIVIFCGNASPQEKVGRDEKTGHLAIKLAAPKHYSGKGGGGFCFLRQCRPKVKVGGGKKKLTLQSSWHICPASAQGRFGWTLM